MWTCPPGVAADAFYPKASHPGLLLRTVEDITRHRKSLLIHRPRLLAPIWIPPNGHDPAGEPRVILTCTECLRTFPQIPALGSSAIHHTDCIYCHIPIKYAIVHSPLPPEIPPGARVFELETRESAKPGALGY